ncbi:hypothetical protein DFH06DRAFT_518436 [Mycena polygramma]|nr:hypothetical protein DFH06DRAFT_518436 [Mycena polygramma]
MAASENPLARLSDATTRRIFQFLEDSELYDLSMTCTRMHKPALSMLLCRRGIPNPFDSVDLLLGDMSNTLQVLRVALFLPSIKRLSLRFSPGITPGSMVAPFPPLTLVQLQATADDLQTEMRRLDRFLRKLESVRDITLTLPGSLEWNLRDVTLELGDTSDIFAWSPVVSFLQEIVEKHCTSLRVTQSPFWAQSRSVARPANATRLRSLPDLYKKITKRKLEPHLTALARWDGVKYHPHKHPLTHTSHITHFHIESTVLLFPGAAGWTFSVLKSSPIISLRLSGLSIDRWDWDLISSKLVHAVPNLLELDIDDREIEPDCLIWMLNRLSKLTALRVGPRMSVYLTYPRIFPSVGSWYLPAFRSLVKLSAPACYVSLFLMRRNPLPALTSLEIPSIHIYQITTTHDHKAMYIHLPMIARRLRDLNHVLSPLRVTISLGWRSSGTFAPLSRHVDSSLALEPQTLDSLREITHLVLKEFDCLIATELLCRWLRLFPALQHVQWDGSQRTPAVTIASIPHLAREISRACPTIETLTAQGVSYSIADVVASARLHEDTKISGFLLLPTEVLLMIFDFLHDELLSLSLLCRGLHFLALPVFLDRNSITHPSETTRVDMSTMQGAVVVRALTIALFIPSINHLICVFPSAYTYHCLDSIRRAARLVQRLTRLEKITLDFPPNICLGIATHMWDVYSASRQWHTCYSALRGLWDAVEGKSCPSLSIVGFPAPAASEPPAPPPAKIRFITNLTIDMDRFTPFSSLIFPAVQHSPIAFLELTITPHTKVEEVPAFPETLTALSLTGEYAPRAWIVAYLGRHPGLKTLSLTCGFSRHHPVAGFPETNRRLRLDHLVNLTAPVSFLSYFLHADDPFPALEHLKIFLDDLPAMGWILASFIERVREILSSPPAIAVELTGHLDVDALTESVRFILSMAGKWAHAGRHIVELALWPSAADLGVFTLGSDAAQPLLNWLRLFRGLRTISMTVTIDAGLAELAQSIGEALPGVQNVNVNQRTLWER